MGEVSVIVPCRNGGDKLLASLSAIIDSLPTGNELLLIDDASTDNYPALVLERLPQVTVLTLDRSSGAAAARNHGLKSARAERLMLVDADVICEPDCISRLQKALDSADISFPTLLSDSGKKLNPRTDFSQRCCLNSAVFGIRRDALRRMDSWFDETIEVYGEDNDFFLRAHRLGLRIRYVKEAQAIHPEPTMVGERHFYLTVRNAVYVWLKLRRVVAYWMPMDAWIIPFLSTHLIGAIRNRSLGYPSIPYTSGSRLRLLLLFSQALAWNVGNARSTLAKRKAFIEALNNENPDL